MFSIFSKSWFFPTLVESIQTTDCKELSTCSRIYSWSCHRPRFRVWNDTI